MALPILQRYPLGRSMLDNIYPTAVLHAGNFQSTYMDANKQTR